jgi:hypothetical protein
MHYEFGSILHTKFIENKLVGATVEHMDDILEKAHCSSDNHDLS